MGHLWVTYDLVVVAHWVTPGSPISSRAINSPWINGESAMTS